ncbi:MAG TPA: response regulator [Candidatus Moranbacteria bacterium]|nr:response regulator [Candidatus Moranbacteria bacterium]
MVKKRILIIEDETTLRETMAEYLSGDNFEVARASDGEEGIKQAKSKKPDLIILDIILPKKDGYEVLEEIKKDPQTKNIPVILLTNLESAENVQKAFEKGATTYLVKSDYSLEDIAKKVKETLKIS